MKKLIPVMAIAALLVGGCASDNAGSQPKAASQANEKTPEVGMTKDQVIALYGKTDNIGMSSDGEMWTYHLNMGEQFIPWNFGYRPKTRVIQFDKEGKVKSWSYTK
jgi:hypothetical protein